MAGIFDFKKGAFDSSEAAQLHHAYEIALQGLKATHDVDRPLGHRLARSIVKVARSEPDCLRNDGTIDPVKLAQRAILRMLQMNAPRLEIPDPKPSLRDRFTRRAATPVPKLVVTADMAVPPPAESPSKIMMRLFERTPFAKL